MKNIFTSETKLRAATCYIEHKNTGRVQEVGTYAIMFDELETMLDSMDIDKRNLGLWFWVNLVGK